MEASSNSASHAQIRVRSGGFRTIIYYRRENRSVFVYGFAKNQRDNLSSDELKAFKAVADVVLNYTDEEMQRAVDAKQFIEVDESEEQNLQE